MGQGDAVLAVELFLDVLVRSDGITHGVYEQREFDQAIRRGWLNEGVGDARCASADGVVVSTIHGDLLW